MFHETVYVQEKLIEHRQKAAMRAQVRTHIEPGSEVERVGVGRVHEVFRRIVNDAEPARGPRLGWLRPLRT